MLKDKDKPILFTQTFICSKCNLYKKTAFTSVPITFDFTILAECINCRTETPHITNTVDKVGRVIDHSEVRSGLYHAVEFVASYVKSFKKYVTWK